jgi:predicted methyltransferase
MIQNITARLWSTDDMPRIAEARCGRPLKAAVLALLAVAASPALGEFDPRTAAAVDAAIGGEHRTEAQKARDAARKPREVLEFLGFRSDMTVVEIWPGSGWYTQILAPALKDDGSLYAACASPNDPYGFQRRGLGSFLKMMGDDPDLYRHVVVTTLSLPYQIEIAPRESADMVVTFRNVHNWFMNLFGGGKYSVLPFQAMYDALKPGGTLGIVDHRWPDPATEDPLAANGYVSKERTIAAAEAVGFELVAESDLLANPRDTRDHEAGVWSLPPGYALGEKDRERYAAIGESDRFLLKFVKPGS